MFTTWGNSSRWVRRRNRPNLVTRRSCSAVQSVAISGAHARIVRNFRISNWRTIPADTLLSVVERSPVPQDVAEKHERDDQHEHGEAAQRRARCRVVASLARSQPYATRRCRRATTHARARQWGACPATARRTATVFAPEHPAHGEWPLATRCRRRSARRGLRTTTVARDSRAASTSGRFGGVLVVLASRRVNQLTTSAGRSGPRARSASSVSISSAPATTTRRSRSTARDSTSFADRRAQDEPREEDDRAAQHDKTREECVAGEELDRRHRERRAAGGHDCGDQSLPTGGRLLRQARRCTPRCRS